MAEEETTGLQKVILFCSLFDAVMASSNILDGGVPVPKWTFSKEEIENSTPSRRRGMDMDQERRQRYKCANMIQCIGDCFES